ncbi:MAG: carbohydrate binding family 9 domain-containing protein [Leptolyngbya sp. SIO3F4]|nr:carbohydrate binding family 9 domain-containing protein [Leptolyngbya sp. SIO3F4]
MAQVTFEPPENPEKIYAARASGPINVDGKLNEASWLAASCITDFIQKDPVQGNPVSMPTEARILFDEEYLYIGAVCTAVKGKTDIRTQNMQRDFDYWQNDMFGIAIDGFLDKRNAMAFQTNPHGTQREILVMDAEIFNREWSALWKVRTQILDTAWTVEMAIPWKTLRYPPGCDKMGIILTRNIRSNNEFVSFPAVPRAFNVYRMPYEAILSGIEPPPPAANVQFTPYALVTNDRTSVNGDVTGESTDFKVGGEVKWVTGPSSVLDFTFNTDFAQADVDRQVVNLTRFSVLFPERRQFFLEGNEIYSMAAWDELQPFFSRRIGLDDNGNPIPIDAGIRFTNRSEKQNIGLLAIRQRENGDTPAANFAVARYSANLSSQGRIGGMATLRYDEADASGKSTMNATATIDGFFRPTQQINSFWMVSGSKTTGAIDDRGLSGATWTYYSNNWIYLGLVEAFVTADYNPRVGFISANNYLLTSPAFSLRLRPKWLPKFIRQYSPGITTYLYNYLDDFSFREGFVSYSPFSVELQNGSEFSYSIRTNWQSLREPFSPVGIEILAGDYQFTSHRFSYFGDFSKKFAFSSAYRFGGYFNGKLNTFSSSLRFAPLPHIQLTADYEFNRLSNLGEGRSTEETHLIGTELRLALNPRVQLISFLQYNTTSERTTLNSRFVWEYRPLSYIYLVYNDNRQELLNPETDMITRTHDQQGIFKVTFLKQF